VTVEVAVDRGTLDDAAVNAAYKSLLVRLVSDGFAFVDLAGGADLIVRLRDAGPKSVFVVVRVGKSKHTSERSDVHAQGQRPPACGDFLVFTGSRTSLRRARGGRTAHARQATRFE